MPPRPTLVTLPIVCLDAVVEAVAPRWKRRGRRLLAALRTMARLARTCRRLHVFVAYESPIGLRTYARILATARGFVDPFPSRAVYHDARLIAAFLESTKAHLPVPQLATISGRLFFASFNERSLLDFKPFRTELTRVFRAALSVAEAGMFLIDPGLALASNCFPQSTHVLAALDAELPGWQQWVTENVEYFDCNSTPPPHSDDYVSEVLLRACGTEVRLLCEFERGYVVVVWGSGRVGSGYSPEPDWLKFKLTVDGILVFKYSRIKRSSGSLTVYSSMNQEEEALHAVAKKMRFPKARKSPFGLAEKLRFIGRLALVRWLLQNETSEKLDIEFRTELVRVFRTVLGCPAPWR
ncbi:hypothetical protein HDU83_009849 [Entophlyctis luteolus]|nr:hypothetical protein HDU83_009849 [Entophlyctis luteolus]